MENIDKDFIRLQSAPLMDIANLGGLLRLFEYRNQIIVAFRHSPSQNSQAELVGIFRAINEQISEYLKLN